MYLIGLLVKQKQARGNIDGLIISQNNNNFQLIELIFVFEIFEFVELFEINEKI